MVGASRVALVVRNPPANAGDVGHEGLVPGSGRLPGGGHGNPLQYSCPENPMDRGAWWATVHGVTKSQTQLKRLSPHSRRLGRPGKFEKRRLERPIMVSKDTGELLKVTTKNRNHPWLSQAPDWEPSRV